MPQNNPQSGLLFFSARGGSWEKILSIFLLVFALPIIFEFFIPSFASTVRLMAMGDMQGIIEDETDYERDLTSFDFKQKNVSSFYLYNNYGSDLFQNFPSYLITDLERKGAQDRYQLNAVYPLNSKFIVGIEYSRSTREYRSAYIDIDGNIQTLKRAGDTETKSVMAGYALTDWCNLGLVYDNNQQNDDYSGTETLWEGVTAKESSSFSGLSYGVKLYNPSYWFNLSMGEIKEGNLTSKTDQGTETYKSSGPGRISLFLGGTLFDGKLRMNYGGYIRKFGYGFQENVLIGAQVKPSDQWLVGVGMTNDLTTSQHFDFYDYSVRLGAEYLVPQVSGLKVRGGMIIRSSEVRDNSYWTPIKYIANCHDYSLGIGYDWGKAKLDFAYKNYQDVTGSDWLTTSTPLSQYYIPTFGGERNSIYVFSVDYEI